MVSATKTCPVCETVYGAAATFCQNDGTRLDDEGVDPFLGKVLLDQFKIEEEIGAGGMGTVYRAAQTSLHRPVAVKILHPELTKNDDAVRRFHREARVATQLDHPNLVNVLLFGEIPEEKNLYLVMEYLDGRTLRDAMEQAAMMPISRVLHILLQVCAGVGAAHAQGIVHRDVKPENVMLVPRGGDPDRVKVLDFGIARILWGDNNTVATQSGMIFGTARYISPEGAEGEPTDARSDVYSIAVLAYQMLSGVTPYEADSPVTMLLKHVNEVPPPIRDMGEGRRVPVPLADVVMKALSKKPGERYEDASEFGKALEDAAEHCAIELPGRRVSTLASNQTPSGPYTAAGLPGQKKRPWWAMAVAFLIGALLFWIIAHEFEESWAGDGSEQIAILESQAREALEAGNYVRPADQSVFAFLERLEERAPEHEALAELRSSALTALRARVEASDDPQEKLIALHDILAFSPSDAEAQAAVEELETPSVMGPSPGLRISPESAQVREPIGLLVVMPLGEHAPEGSRFEIYKRGRRVRTVTANRVLGVSDAAAEQWAGQYSFRSSGEYEIRFSGAPESDEFRATVTIARRASSGGGGGSPRPPAPYITPMQVRPPSVMMTTPPRDDGIDWSLPGSQMRTSPTVMSIQNDDPPAPWTG